MNCIFRITEKTKKNTHFLIGKASLQAIIILTFISCSITEGVTTPIDLKSKAIYQKISAKIAKLERERIAKTARIKNAYSPVAAKIAVGKLNIKIDRAIERYKVKGNRYFRRKALLEPWPFKPTNPTERSNSPPLTMKNVSPPATQPRVRRSTATKNNSSHTKKSNSVPPPPITASRNNELLYQTPPSLPFDHNEFPVTTSTTSSGGSSFLPLAISALVGGFFLFSAVFLILYFAFFRKSTKTAKILMGCGFLAISGMFCVALIIASIFWMGSSPTSTEKNVTPRDAANQPIASAPVDSTIAPRNAIRNDGRAANNTSNRPSVLKEGKTLPHPLVSQAETAVRKEDLESLKAAIIAARQDVERHPDSVEALMRLGKILVVINNNEDVNIIVDDIFSRILRLDPDNIAAQRYLADARYRSGLYNSALIILEPLLEEGVLSDPKTWGLVNLCFMRDEQYEAGLDFFKRMAEKHPGDPYIRLNRAVLARQICDFTLARAEIKKVIARPDIPNSLRNTAKELLTICQGGN